MKIKMEVGLAQNTKSNAIENAQKEEKCDENDDYVEITIGAFGYWQLLYIAIAAITRMMIFWNIESIVFLAPKTDFLCLRFNDNATTVAVNNTCYDSCEEYSYNSDIFEQTATSEFGLICQNEWLISVTQSLMMFGIFCGVFIFGWISDRFGRSKGIVISGVTCTFFMFIIPFCPNYWSFTVARFFAGFGSGGYVALSVVYMSELVGSRFIGSVISLATNPFDGGALPIQAGFAYLTTNWRTFTIVYSSVAVLLVSVTFFLPETPRWLIAKGKVTEAIDMLTRAGRLNKRETSNIGEKITAIIEKLNAKEKNDVNLTYLDLFRNKKLAKLTVILLYLWIITGFSYYGLLQHISHFGSNLYVVVIISGLVQVIAAPMTVVIVKFFRRKTSSVILYATIGCLSLGLMFTPHESTIGVILGGLGVIASTFSFTVVYVIVMEIYPTSVRNMGLSVSSVGSKVAAMVAPFVVNMKTQWIASLIFSVAGFSAVLFCFLLPETKGKQLKDTLEEYE